MSLSSPDASISIGSAPRPIACAVWHSLFWLVFANAIGVLLSILLLVPSLNGWLGEWTYGRWIMVHMNLELYGWTSLPMVGFLFKVYQTERAPLAEWCRPVLWAWSAALGVGAFSWLSGHSSGKLFLDWSGYARIVFPLAMLALWLLLAVAFVYKMKNRDSNCARRKNCWTFVSTGCSLCHVRGLQPQLLSRHQSRHRRTDRRKPA